MTAFLLKGHTTAAFALTGACALGGLWSAYFWATRRSVPKALEVWYVVCYVLVYLQVGLGALLYSRGLRPGEGTHVLYGITPAVVTLILVSSRTSFESRRVAVMTVALLAFAGMGVRGIMTGFAG